MPVKWSEVYESTGDLHQTICEAKNADFIFLMKSSYAKSEKILTLRWSCGIIIIVKSLFSATQVR